MRPEPLPLQNIPLTDDQISCLLFKMNSLVNEFHSTEMFAKLPLGTWHIKYRIKNSVLFVNILLTDIKDHWGPITDPMYWIYWVARGIGYKLRENPQMVSEGSRIYFRVYLKSELGDQDFSFAINGIDLFTLAMLRGNPLDDPGTVVASLNLDTEEFDKLNDK